MNPTIENNPTIKNEGEDPSREKARPMNIQPRMAKSAQNPTANATNKNEFLRSCFITKGQFHNVERTCR
jgi:hypothetical protein